MQLTRTLGLALLAIAVIGCSDDDPASPDPDLATVVIANTAFGTADVDVEVAGITAPIALDLDFGEFTAICTALPAETQITMTFTSGVEVLATEQVTLEDDQRYTVLLTTNGATEHVVVLEDEVDVPQGQRAVRIVNATTDPGDAYVFAAGGAMGDAAVTNVPYVGTAAAAPQFLLRAEGQTEVRFFDPGVNTGTPRAEETLPSAAAAPVANVLMVETATTTEAFVLEPCP